MAQIPTTPSLRQLQQYQHDMCAERGWDQASSLETFLLFMEEVGELANAIRYKERIWVRPDKQVSDAQLAREFSDVLSYLMELANRYGVDLEQAYRDKEAINATRTWENG
ncbi:MAG: MazG nucleotide pyrophosphohydrolase domain-containing protein [Bacteroidia bacterium]|nr:MazG nucleotide pyrophosphohydrolase domain-containing protein [Bacteroidia bacterium]